MNSVDDYVRSFGMSGLLICDELRHKPIDCQLLDQFADSLRPAGLACDLGCGPGHVARYLHDRGVRMCGVDLSPDMIEQARELNPEIEFCQGDMRSLEVPSEEWAGIAAFYAIVNLPPGDVLLAVREMWRVLESEGLLVLSFHIGDTVEHVEDLWGCAVCLDFYFFHVQEVTGHLRAAGFEIGEIVEREPYAPDVEYQSRRAYIFARKPSHKR